MKKESFLFYTFRNVLTFIFFIIIGSYRKGVNFLQLLLSSILLVLIGTIIYYFVNRKSFSPILIGTSYLLSFFTSIITLIFILLYISFN